MTIVTGQPSKTSAERTESAAVLEVDALSKRFTRKGGKEFLAVDNVSLSLSRGEMVVLLGPSGCGKTTLLRCIAGLEELDGGVIRIGGRQVEGCGRRVAPERRNVGMMFQSYALWPHMTVRDNVAYPLAARRVSTRDARERVMDMLRVVGTDALADQYPGQLSGGQQQRVALARCLVASPDLLLFDEPLSNVDAKVRDTLRREILDMQDRLGFAGVYVTHDQEEAMRMADRLAVMESGSIVQVGTPEEIYHSPHTFYVANFVGALNSWHTYLEPDGRGVGAELDGLGRLALGDDQLGPGVDRDVRGKAVVVLVRPEAIALAKAEPADLGRAGFGEVVREVFVGSHRERIVRLHTGRELTVWSHERGTDEPRRGDAVEVRVSPSNVRVVRDPADGNEEPA